MSISVLQSDAVNVVHWFCNITFPALNSKAYFIFCGPYSSFKFLNNDCLTVLGLTLCLCWGIQVSYNIMIHVYANAGVHHEVEKLFQAMQRQGCLPDSFTYLSLVQAYTESLNYSKAEETIHAMQSKGIPPSCAHFNILLSAFTKAGLIDEAKRVYKGLSTFGLIPDLICYRTMLKGYLRYGCVEEGINFFESICKSTKGDRFIMSAAVHLYKSVGMESQAKEILSSMNKMRIPFLRKLEVGMATTIATTTKPYPT